MNTNQLLSKLREEELQSSEYAKWVENEFDLHYYLGKAYAFRLVAGWLQPTLSKGES